MSDPTNALFAAAPDGVDFDGLVVESSAYGYSFETPETSERGLSTPELHEVAVGDPYVENWYFWTHNVSGGPDSAQYAFLRWVEHAATVSADSTDGEGGADGESADGALDPAERITALDEDGLEREWGELRIRARRETGVHVYDLRHADDASTDVDDLDTYVDPLDARQLVKHDDSGEYRPLKSAPTLPHGWAYPDLDPDELVETVEFVYPASIANWYREQQDALDVTHWQETANRQSGIYEIVQDLPREALEWAAEACCTDGACVKRREWDNTETDALDVPRGDGEFPCREPCSVFITAARKFTTLEREDDREYTFELTPTEKEQLEGILDAVADDTVDEVRAADLNEDANQFRARYLRAKRSTERGFGDQPTYE